MGRHDDDAGGDPAVLEEKAALREAVWDRLEAAGVGRFPGVRGRISNFVGAEQAAERLRGLSPWTTARRIKANPDSPQWPVRQRALEDGKTVYMAVPRLTEDRPFLRLDPERLEESPRSSSSIKGASRAADPVGIDQVARVDLVVVGCVAVTEGGARLGKGGGFSDLEFAILAEAGLVDQETVVATTVHEVQVLERGAIPETGHDVRLDLVVTPERVVTVDRDGGRPPGIRWEALTEDKIAAIPVLQRLRPA